MQVAHHKDHVTHAVIGGGETIDFGISQSAEFFNILSSTLYKDQILAVVREVLCNAWDAHIEAGCTDKPVQITLTDEKFTIRDFGKGIHRDDMGLIYGTYGNSTKKNDGMQTGGFGLGCKAPFAYTDHFEVISCHDGVKTIYNLSKSSAQAMGKPGIVPIASFPTTDTGLEVTIRIHSRGDRMRFGHLAHRIVYNGDMNMTLNGQQLDTLGFDAGQSSFLITRSEDIMDDMKEIMVRYGNVIYPVSSAEAIQPEYTLIMNELGKLMNNGSYYSSNQQKYQIIFQAPPHSISVTPSRESLSMQEHTINTLKKLFQNFLARHGQQFMSHCNAFAVEAVQEAVNESKVGLLLTRQKRLPFISEITAPAVIADLGSMARRYMQIHYPATLDFRKNDIRQRLKAMVAAGLLADRGLVQTYLKELDRLKNSHDPSDWMQRRVLGPLAIDMRAAGIPTTKLFVRDASCNYANNMMDPMVPFHRYGDTLLSSLVHLRNIIVVTTSLRDFTTRCYKHEVFQKLGSYEGFMVYHCGMKKAEKVTALEFFKARGMNVVDLTVKQPWEISEELRKMPTAPRKPAKQGLPLLKDITIPGDVDLNIARSLLDDVKRIDHPEFVVNVSIRKDQENDHLYPWNAETSRYIVKLFGDKGAITNNSLKFTKAIKDGAVSIQDYVTQKVSEYMLNCARIHEYWAFDVHRAANLPLRKYYHDQVEHVILQIYGNDTARKELGLVSNLTEEDKIYVHLWKQISRDTDLAKSTHAFLSKILVDPHNNVVLSRIRNTPLINLIDTDAVNSAFEAHSPGTPHHKQAVQVLLSILNP